MKLMASAFSVGLVIGVAGLICGSEAVGQERPNIVLIVADDLGWGDVACYGGDFATPHIDALAAQGRRFTQFYATAPVCTPSRYSMMTGRYPQRALGGLDKVGMMFNAKHKKHGLTKAEPTLANALRKAGYRTALIGKWHLGHGGPAQLPQQHGFDYFYGMAGGCADYFTHRYGFVPDWYRGDELIDEPGYATTLLTQEAIAWLKQQDPPTGPSNQPVDSKPFFLVISHLAPHYGKSLQLTSDQGSPVTGPGADRTLVTRSAGEQKDASSGKVFHIANTLQVDEALPESATARSYFQSMVQSMDASIGQVVAHIEQSAYGENTLIIFLSDHGSDMTVSSAGRNKPLRGGKHSLWEGGIRIPCIMRWPRQFSSASVSAQISSTLDLFPSLIKLGQGKSNALLDGIDLSQTWFATETNALISRTLFWKHGRQYAIRRGPWKLIDDQLYDLSADLSEGQNQAAAQAAIVKTLRDDFQAKLKAIKTGR